MSSSSPQAAVPTAATASSTDQLQVMLRRHIQRAGQLLKIQDMATYLFAWLGTLVTLWMVACLVEHWLVPLPLVLRWALWLAIVGLSSWLCVRYMLPLLLRRINPDYVAQRIEKAEPELKTGLVSWLQLESMPDNGVPRGIMAGLARHAARHIHADDPSSSLDTRLLIKTIGLTMLLMATMAVYGMLAPKSVWDTGKRVLMPWSSIAAPARVQLVELTPGAAEITQGKPLPINVKLKGLRSGEVVSVRYSTLDGQLRDQVKSLDAIVDGFEYSGSVSTAQASGSNARGMQHEIDYWIEAGDLKSGPYRITLGKTPVVTLDNIVIQFPAYTKLPERTLGTGEIEAVEGSRVVISASANQPLTRGQIELNPTLDGSGNLLRTESTIKLDALDRQLSGKWLLELNSARDNPTLTRYRLRGFNARNDGNDDPIEYRARVLADVAPEVTVPGPEDRTLRMLASGQVNIEVRAIDPDFGLSRISLAIKRNNMPLKDVLLLESDGATGRQVKKWRFKAADYRASVGDRFIFLATVEDNHHDFAGQPAPNRAQSQPLTIEIVAPEELAKTDAAHQPPTKLDPADQEVQPNRSDGSSGDNGSPSEPSSTDQSTDPKAQGQQNNNNNNSPSRDSKPNDANDRGSSGDNNSKEDQPNSDKDKGNPSDQSKANQEKGDQDKGNQDKGNQQQGSQNKGSQSQGGQQQNSGQQKGGQQQNSGQQGGQDKGNSSGVSSKDDQNSSGQSGESSAGQSSSSGQSSSGNSSGKSSDKGSANGQSGANGQKSNGKPNGGSGGNAKSPSNNQAGDDSQGNSRSGNNATKNGQAGESSKDASGRDGNSNNGDAGQQRDAQGSSSGSGQRTQGQRPDGQSSKSNSKPTHDGEVIERVRDLMNQQREASDPTKPNPNKQNPSNQQAQRNQQQQKADSKQTGQQQAGQQQAGQQQAGQQQAGQQQAGQQQAGQQQAGQQQAGQQQAGQQQAGQQQAGQQAGQQQAGQQQAGQQQSGQQQAGQQQAGQQQGGQQQAGQQQAGQQQGGQQQAGQQQAGQQQAGQQQAGQQQAGQQQAGQQQGGQQQGGQQQGGQQQAGQQQGGQQQGGQQQAGQQQAGQQQAGQQQAGQQQAGQQQAGQQQAGQQQAGQQQAGQQQAGQQQAGQQQGGQQQAGQQQGGQQQGGQQQGGQQQGGQQQGGQQQGGQQQGGQQQGGQQQGGQQQGGQQQGGQQQGGQQQGGQQQAGQQQGGQQQGGQQQGGQQQGGQQQGGQQQGGQQQGGQQQGGQQSGQQSGGKSPGNGGGSGSGGVPGQQNDSGAGPKPAQPLDTSIEPKGHADANEQYANEVTNLVLDYLKEQKNQPDPELLKELNWSKEDLAAFLKRWESARNLSQSPDPAQKRKWTDELRALGLAPPTNKALPAAGRDEKLNGLRDSGSRMRAPESLRRQFDAFRKAVQETEK